MVKRNAKEQITKETYVDDAYDPDDRDPGGRDRSEEPMTVASTDVLAKRKILKPRSRASATPGRTPLASSSMFQGPAGDGATPTKPSFGSLFGAATQPSTPALFGAPTVAQTEPPKANPFATIKSTSSLFGVPSSTNDVKKANPFASVKAPIFGSSNTTLEKQDDKPKATTPPSSSANFFSNFGAPPSTPKQPSTPARQTTNPLFNFGTTTPQAQPPSADLFGTSNQPSSQLPAKASSTNLFGSTITTTPSATPSKNTFGGTQNSANSVLATTTTTTTTTATAAFGANSMPISGFAFSSSKDATISGPPESFSPAPIPSFNFGSTMKKAGEQKPVDSDEVKYPLLFGNQGASANWAGAKTPEFKPSENLTFQGFTGFGSKPTPQTELSGTPKQDNTSKVNGTMTARESPQKNLASSDMPDYNFMLKVRSLNQDYIDRLQKAYEKDPLGDWTEWAIFYSTQMATISRLRSKEKSTSENTTMKDVDLSHKVSTDKSMTDAPTEEVTSSQTQHFDSTSKSGEKVSMFSNNNTAFGDHKQNNFASAASKSSQVFPTSTADTNGASIFNFSKTTNTTAPSTQTSLFNFGSQNTAKPSAEGQTRSDTSSLFSFAPKPTEPIQTQGSSILSSGSAGLSKANDGGWANPFAKLSENAMFITDNSDKSDDEEEEEGHDVGKSTYKHEEVPTSVDTSPDLSQTPAKDKSTNSLFNKNPTMFQFGSSTPKTGSVGLFAGTPPVSKDKDHTWTPDKPITFGPPSSGGTKENEKTATPLFGNTTTSSLFGTNTGTAPSTSIFNFGNTAAPNPKPVDVGFTFGAAANTDSPKPSLFGNNTLAPSAASSIFGGKSPMPSSVGTPATDVESERGGEDNDEDGSGPSDEAGQGASNAHDLSGPGPGEEDEDTKFDIRSAIYQVAKGNYNKIGIGRLRVLKHRLNDKGRVIAKLDSGKILMNVALQKQMDYIKSAEGADSKIVKVMEVLASGAPRIWVLKVKEAENAVALRQAIEDNK